MAELNFSRQLTKGEIAELIFQELFRTVNKFIPHLSLPNINNKEIQGKYRLLLQEFIR